MKKFTIKHIQYGFNGTEVEYDLIINALSIEDLLYKVDQFENNGVMDHIEEVYHTDEETFSRHAGSGGTCSDFISALDENGNDVSKYLKDWYGEPLK